MDPLHSEMVRQLRKFDNDQGYKREYDDVKQDLAPVMEAIIAQGNSCLPELHALISNEETWSCLFALEILKELKNEESIPFLIAFIRKNEDGEYWEACDDALFALQAIGKPAIGPILSELRELFKEEIYLGYLVGALTEIKEDRVYAFMVELVGQYISAPSQFKEWFEIDDFTHGFVEQKNKEALPLLKQIVEMDHLEEQQVIELNDTIEALEDPEAYERSVEELREKIRIEKGKPGKNDPCHCGSEIKYKKCCMEEDLREKERKLRGEG